MKKEKLCVAYDVDRYYFDADLCSKAKGFYQFDTGRDTWYRGVWVNPFSLRIVSYCESDVYFTYCDTVEEFIAEVKRMATFYTRNGVEGVGIDAEGTMGGDLLADMGLGEWVHFGPDTFELTADGRLLSRDKVYWFEPEDFKVLRLWEDEAEIEFRCSPAPCPWYRETGADYPRCAWEGDDLHQVVIDEDFPYGTECLWCQLYGDAPVEPEC